MSAMVSKDIVHRDLKPQNILLHYEGRTSKPHHARPQDIKLKIADFGFARFLQDGVMAATLCGSPMYMAPEVIMSLQYNHKADLWSLGTIVFQCLTGKAPFQAQTPQALKHFYEKNANLAPRLPPGISAELANLLMGLLKRDAKDRIDFEGFFKHPFIRSDPAKTTVNPGATTPTATVTKPRPAAAATTTAAVRTRTSPMKTAASPQRDTPTRTVAEVPRKPQDHQAAKRDSNGSSPEQQVDDFVMVPEHLTMDAAEVRKKQQSVKPSPGLSRRHTVSGAPTSAPGGPRPASLPVQPNPMPEAVPVPSMKGAYQQMQQSLARSRTKSGDSVSAMSGVSSASGGSTLGPLPEEGVAPLGTDPSPTSARRSRPSSLSSPMSSPKSPSKQQKTRRMNSAQPQMAAQNAVQGAQPQMAAQNAVHGAQPQMAAQNAVPDICQMSPPQTQYTMGTPPLGHRRRTSSSSSGAATPPPPVHFSLGGQPVPNTRLAPISPNRAAGPRIGTVANPAPAPCLSPILGSPNKSADANNPNNPLSTALIQRGSSSSSNTPRAITVPENLCTLPEGAALDTASGASGAAGAAAAANVPGFRRRSSEMQFRGSSGNIVLNYGDAGLFTGSPYDTGRMLARRHSLTGGGANTTSNNPFAGDLNFVQQELSEETLLAPEHNEVLAKLKFISQYVDAVIDVARFKAAPLSVLTESIPSSRQQGVFDQSSSLHRRAQQLLLYMRCLHLLSQSLDFSRAELKSKKLKPTTTVKNVLATLNERFRHCISMTKMLNSENLLAECGLEQQNNSSLADHILYQHALEQCQSAALDELFGNPGECFQRYHTAHILLHALEHHAKTDEEKSAIAKYTSAVDKRLSVLSHQGFITAYETYIH